MSGDNADILVGTRIPAYVTDLIHLWTDCIAGGSLAEDYLGILTGLGFVDAEVVEVFDVFEGTQIGPSAAKVEARGGNVRARVLESTGA